MAKERKCPSCGKSTRTIGDYCPYCAASMGSSSAAGSAAPSSNPQPSAQSSNSTNINVNTGRKANNMSFDKFYSNAFKLLVLLLVLAGVVWVIFWMFGIHPIPQPAPVATTAQVQATAAPASDDGSYAAQATEAPASAAQATAAPAVVSNTQEGIDYPSKSWFIAKAGTVVSGDICVFDNDNNSKKTPIYDSKEGTADIVLFTKDTYVWAEWGCYAIENANQQSIADLINDKVGSYSVRYFSNYSKLGNHAFVIYKSKITVADLATK